MKKKFIIIQFLYNIKKNHINLFPLYSIKKSIRQKKKNFKRKKNKIGNILKYFSKNILRLFFFLKCRPQWGRIQHYWYFFKSVLGLACQPDPTALGLATKTRPSRFWQRKPNPQPQFLTKNTGKERLLGCYSVVHS